MSSALNIRDIGDARKRALTEEARARGIPVADLVREWIDEGLDAARRAREGETWRRAAMPGIESEQRFLDAHGPTLARYRIGAGRSSRADGGDNGSRSCDSA